MFCGGENNCVVINSNKVKAATSSLVFKEAVCKSTYMFNTCVVE